MRKEPKVKEPAHVYWVKWEIDIAADTPEQAVEKVYKIMERARTDAPYLYLRDEDGKRFRLPKEE